MPTDDETLARGRANLRTWPLVSSDGVTVTAWDNQGGDPSGPGALPVVVCAGLGTPPETWPLLLADPARYRLVGTYYRGTAAAPVPVGPPPTVQDHARDACAVMDAAGMDRALLVGWSMGVNIACTVALDSPERVAGVLGVCGVPGDTFAALGGRLPLPRAVRRRLGELGSVVVSAAGPALMPLAHGMSGDRLQAVARRVGFTMPSASPAYLGAVLGHLLAHETSWYFRLAAGSGAQRRLDLASITRPVTLIAGRWDVITDPVAVRECAEAIPGCRFVQLSASHFLPTEHQHRCEVELRSLARRCGLA